MRKKTILLFAVNPKDTPRLNLDDEVRVIETGLERARMRDQFELKQKHAVHLEDIRRALLDLKPQIIHFCGHGTEEGLIFKGETGQSKIVTGEALTGLFKLFANDIQCVVLNGCYSVLQAVNMAQHIPCVVGMRQAIGDQAAINFSVGFYDGLGADRPIEFAYELGCNSILLDKSGEHLIPILILKAKLQEINQVVERLTKEPDPEKRYKIIFEIGRIGGAEAEGVLLSMRNKISSQSDSISQWDCLAINDALDLINRNKKSHPEKGDIL